MKKRFHICIDIRNAMRNHKDLGELLCDESGSSLPHLVVLEIFMAELNLGRKYWVGCEKRTESGRCAGHAS